MLHTLRTNERVFELNDNYEAIDELREGGYGDADFTVSKAKVMFQTGLDFEGDLLRGVALKTYDAKEVYYREDTGEPIAIHGLRYQPIQYTTMIDKSRDMIERCNLDATGVQEKISVSPNGGMCFVEYKLPAKEYTTPDGDKGYIKIMALSSFNGVWSFILSLGFHQSACLNSQIFIKNPASIYKARHTNKLDIDLGVSVLGKAANIVEDEIELWHELYNTPTLLREELEVFAEVAEYTGELDEIGHFDYSSYPSNKALNYMLCVYQDNYAKHMGHNRWAVYNAVTDWSTHGPSSAKNKIALMQRRTDQASEVLTKYLLAA